MQYHENPALSEAISTIEAELAEGNLPQATDDILSLYDIATALDDPTALAAAQLYMAGLERRNGNPDRCTVLQKKALSIALAHDSAHLPFFCMRAYTGLAEGCSQQGDYYASLGNYLNAYHIASAHPEYHFEARLLKGVGDLFILLDEFAMGLGYLTNAYDTYMERGMDDRDLLAALVWDTADAYACGGDYGAAYVWAEKPVDWTEQERAALTCMHLACEVLQHHDRGDTEAAIDAMEQFLSQAQALEDGSPLLHAYLYTGRLAIELGAHAMAEVIVARLGALDGTLTFGLFRYHYAELCVSYHRRFLPDEQASPQAQACYLFYYEESRTALQHLKRNYLSSLLLELEVDKLKYANNSVLRRSFHLETDLELDPLTGLLNRASVEKYVTQRMAARQKDTAQAMLLISIADFKHLNDLYGHHFGDMLLLEVADILNECVVSDSVVARFGGGEFLLFMSHAQGEDNVQSLVLQIVEYAADILLPDDRVEAVTFQVGGALIDRPMTFDEALALVMASMENQALV